MTGKDHETLAENFLASEKPANSRGPSHESMRNRIEQILKQDSKLTSSQRLRHKRQKLMEDMLNRLNRKKSQN